MKKANPVRDAVKKAAAAAAAAPATTPPAAEVKAMETGMVDAKAALPYTSSPVPSAPVRDVAPVPSTNKQPRVRGTLRLPRRC